MLSLEYAGHVATVTLDRPPVNAWNDKALDNLEEVIRALRADKEVRLVLVVSAHRHFSAGGDIAMMAQAIDLNDVAALDRFAARLQGMFAMWAELPVPTLAVLRGAVTGGGLEFALACDLRLASEDCRIGLPECGLGLIPAGGGTQRLVAAIGRGAALRMMLTAELVGGRRAAELGIIEWCVPDAELEATAEAVVDQLLATSPAAARAVKDCVSRAGSPGGFAAEIHHQSSLHANADTQRRLKEFVINRGRKNAT